MTSVVPLVVDIVARVRDISPNATLCLDSRQVNAGDVFVACGGRSSDGRDYIADAVARQAAAVIHEGELTPTQQQALGSVPGIAVQGLRGVLGALASAWWGHPSSKLTIIAITGTNGKTTTAQWLAAALRQGNVRCGVMGTLGVTDVDGQRQQGWLTTPDVLSMHACLAQLLDQGATHVVMEASSIGLDQGRLDEVMIDVAVYTNLTQDHLDYHGDMTTYAQAKALLFQREELKHAIINIDDDYASDMMQRCTATVLTYGIDSQIAGLQACDLVQSAHGQQFKLNEQNQSVQVQTSFVGAHVVANMLAVAGVLRVLTWPLEKIGAVLAQLPPVPGRLEMVTPVLAKPSLPAVVVDYAHTPDGLRNALQALAPVVRARSGRLWCVVGCGGDRDRQKRPLMAQVAQDLSDRVVLTSDNPRGEDPHEILRQMVAGLQDCDSVIVNPDRAQAILTTVWAAESHDVILIAGKGDERYQEVAGWRHPFDDRQWSRLALLMAADAPAVQSDTRALQPGAVFVALRGERFDGHDYLEVAREQGATAAIVERMDESVDLPQIVLGPTLAALQTLARAWRGRFDIPVIAVTGSNGKTTTKEMIAAICRDAVGTQETLATAGNLNNEIGVPLTLMQLSAQHRIAVIEMGMNHPGEIALLSSMVQPTVALVLNAQREHQEFMKSVEAVAQENGQALVGLSAQAVAVYPAGDPYTDLWARLSGQAKKRLTFGSTPDAHVRVQLMSSDAVGSRFMLAHDGQQVEVTLNMVGEHNVINAAAAAACAVAAGISLSKVAQALAAFTAVKGRMQVHRLPAGEVLIDDTYNANPDSVRAAIDVLARLPAPRALVLGDMGEVGDQGPAMHSEVGQYAKERSIDHVWAMGQATQATVNAFGAQGQWFKTPDALCEHAQRVRPRSMLVKGSRFMAMERVVSQWLGCQQARAGATVGAGGEHAG